MQEEEEEEEEEEERVRVRSGALVRATKKLQWPASVGQLLCYRSS